MGMSRKQVVIPDAAKRQSGIHNRWRFGMNAVPTLRDRWLWIPGSRLISRAPE
jgi:hypothetical protein